LTPFQVFGSRSTAVFRSVIAHTYAAMKAELDQAQLLAPPAGADGTADGDRFGLLLSLLARMAEPAVDPDLAVGTWAAAAALAITESATVVCSA
jgi:hypothetical protein